MNAAQLKLVKSPSEGRLQVKDAGMAPVRQKISYWSIFIEARNAVVASLGEQVVGELERELMKGGGLDLVVRHTGGQKRFEVRYNAPLPDYLAWAHSIYQQELNKHLAHHSSQPLKYG